MSDCTVSVEWEEHDGLKFFAKTWKPTGEVKGAVVFIHGIEHVERYDHVFPRYAAVGIAVLAYDQRGFGQTGQASNSRGATSWPKQLHDAEHFIRLQHERYPNVPLFLVGHSMGGGVALAFATRSPPHPGSELLAGVVAGSPLIKLPPKIAVNPYVLRAGGVLGWLRPRMQVKAAVVPEHIARDEEVQKTYMADPLCAPFGTYKGVSDMLHGGASLVDSGYKAWPEKLPLLVLHGTDDYVTSWDASKELVDKLQALGRDVTWLSLDGYYHEVHNEPGELKFQAIEKVTGWLQSKL